MSFDQVDISLPDDFDNIVRLFPLPNLVLFPGVVQALHLFESRYLAMMEDALASDGLIAMILIHPGWKSELLDKPKLCKTVCLGKIFTHSKLDDGRYNLLLIGVKRGRIVNELETDKPYRMAEIEIVESHGDEPENQSEALRKQVTEEFRQLVSERPLTEEEALDELLQQQLPLGQLLDLICYSCGAPPKDQQTVLDELDVYLRAEIVLNMLRETREKRKSTKNGNTGSDYPPDFSVN